MNPKPEGDSAMPKQANIRKKIAALPLPEVSDVALAEVNDLVSQLAEAADLDGRPAPHPRKIAGLWQSYLAWFELVQIRKRHILRHTAILRGKSSLSLDFEADWQAEFGPVLDAFIALYRQQMIDEAALRAGPVWAWLTSIRGLGEGSLAAQLLAQIDDIGRFDNISKLWRFAGYGVVDGKHETNVAGEKSHYNALLKSIIYLVGDQFIKQRTEGFREVYDAEKARQKTLHPQPVCAECGLAAVQGKRTINGEEVQTWRCPTNGNHRTSYTPAHIDLMARRKIVKLFLSRLWLIWREAEGLPTSEPYAMAILGHSGWDHDLP